MKRLVTSAFVVATLAVPVGFIAASPATAELQDLNNPTKDKKDKKDKDRSVPAPATLLLLAAAGGVAIGVSRYRRRHR